VLKNIFQCRRCWDACSFLSFLRCLLSLDWSFFCLLWSLLILLFLSLFCKIWPSISSGFDDVLLWSGNLNRLCITIPNWSTGLSIIVLEHIWYNFCGGTIRNPILIMTDQFNIFFIKNFDKLLIFLFVYFIFLLEESFLLCYHLSSGGCFSIEETFWKHFCSWF